jgi:hypothetical protein
MLSAEDKNLGDSGVVLVLVECGGSNNHMKSSVVAVAIVLCKITATLWSTDKQFCQITGTLLHIVQAILPNHWHAPPHTGNSAKSLAQCTVSTDRQ